MSQILSLLCLKLFSVICLLDKILNSSYPASFKFVLTCLLSYLPPHLPISFPNPPYLVFGLWHSAPFCSCDLSLGLSPTRSSYCSTSSSVSCLWGVFPDSPALCKGFSVPLFMLLLYHELVEVVDFKCSSISHTMSGRCEC